jgi:hypothetical protein
MSRKDERVRNDEAVDVPKDSEQDRILNYVPQKMTTWEI